MLKIDQSDSWHDEDGILRKEDTVNWETHQ